MSNFQIKTQRLRVILTTTGFAILVVAVLWHRLFR